MELRPATAPGAAPARRGAGRGCRGPGSVCPVVVVLASRVSLVAIPCNLLAEFAVAPATVLGFAALAVAPVAMPVAELLAWVAGWPVGWIASVARTGAALPGRRPTGRVAGGVRHCWLSSRLWWCCPPAGSPVIPGSVRRRRCFWSWPC
ncbi:ComEC/Rec2 family competence protein [Streptomyces sp. M10(2022)]